MACKKGKECRCGKCLPDSGKKFPDGANYRIEVSGIECAYIARKVIAKARELKIPIHRMIATVAGSKHYSDEQLKELAQVAADNRVEVIICPGSLADAIIQNPNRILSMNFDDSNEVSDYYAEIQRCLFFGFRGFLVWTFGVLASLNKIRKNFPRHIPHETIFKVSTFANCRNIYDFRLAYMMGADTVNAANNRKFEELIKIRKDFSKPIDMHIVFWQVGFDEKQKLMVRPYDRIIDAPEIARICSPVYFKFENDGGRGIRVYDFSKSDWTLKHLAELRVNDVNTIADIIKTISKKYHQLKLSDWGPGDLRIPKV